MFPQPNKRCHGNETLLCLCCILQYDSTCQFNVNCNIAQFNLYEIIEIRIINVLYTPQNQEVIIEPLQKMLLRS